jgi:hypothetical protein
MVVSHLMSTQQTAREWPKAAKQYQFIDNPHEGNKGSSSSFKTGTSKDSCHEI